MHIQKILILDFGSQYSQLIARRIREIGVYCEIHPFDWSTEKIKSFAPDGIILSGGPSSATQEERPTPPDFIYQMGCPILGICYGMQVMAAQLGGQVSSEEGREYGYARLRLHGHSQLFHQIEDHIGTDNSSLLDVWMSHGDQVVQLPEKFKALAQTTDCEIAAMGDDQRHFYGLQFHPEVKHTQQGQRLLERFIVDICQCERNWLPSNIIRATIAECREMIGQDHVVLGLSGGIDSAVAAILLHKAIGEQLTCVFVDNGLLRLHEAEQVIHTFGEHFGIKILAINAEERFLHALQGITDPEQKRKVIGHKFINIFEEQAKNLKNVRWLAQGTIYPDVIESAATKTGKGSVIKSHHNVAGLPDKMSLKIIEPLRELFKDEVRTIGLELGLPHELVYRHPFPGPGLAVRILGEIKKEYADTLRLTDAIFVEELHKNNLYYKVSQAFSVLLPVSSVGVLGDNRHYAPVVALRAVETDDFMTAHWSHLPYDFLGHVSNRIINEVKGISRVVYDISGKPPATIEWE